MRSLQHARYDSGVVNPGFWSGKRVLLTGHTGFKGGWLALWLTSMGAEVVGLANGRPTQPSLFDVARIGHSVKSVETDVRDFEGLERVMRDFEPEVVLHLAAQPIVRTPHEDPVSTQPITV